MKQHEAQKIAGWLQSTLIPMIEGCFSFAQEGDDGWQDNMQDYLKEVATSVHTLYMRPGEHALQDVADFILMTRRNAPQLSLFPDIRKYKQ